MGFWGFGEQYVMVFECTSFSYVLLRFRVLSSFYDLDLIQKGLPSAHAFIPPEFMERFGRQIAVRLGS